MKKRFGVLPVWGRRLTAREQRVLELRYGQASRRRSYHEVGALLGLSALEVRRLEHAALERLRHVCDAQLVWDEA